jgi:hypothetical protein
MYDAETNGYDGGEGKRKGRDEKVETVRRVRINLSERIK